MKSQFKLLECFSELILFLLAVSSWRWNSCSRENRDYFGKTTSKEIRRARESELIYYATIHWLSTKLENNRDDSQDDLELALNLKLKDVSLVNKHNLLRPNSKTEWSMWYAGKIARQHSNCVDQISELFAFPGKLSTEITLPDYKVRILVKKLSKRRWECQIPTKNLTKPLYGDGVYGKVTSRMTSQHYIFRAFLWLEFDWSKHFAYFLLAETDFLVFSLLTAQVSKQRWLPRNVFRFRSRFSGDSFWFLNHKWRVIIFKVSFNWREVFSLACRSGCLL